MSNPNDRVTVTTEVDVQTDGEKWSATDTQQRTYGFQIESYDDLHTAATREGVRVLAHFLDADVYSPTGRKGWAVDLADGVTAFEGRTFDIQINVGKNTVYELAAEGKDSPTDVYTRLWKVAVGRRSSADATEALLTFINHNTECLDREKISDEWEVPDLREFVL